MEADGLIKRRLDAINPQRSINDISNQFLHALKINEARSRVFLIRKALFLNDNKEPAWYGTTPTLTLLV
jgi:hypothetical protein